MSGTNNQQIIIGEVSDQFSAECGGCLNVFRRKYLWNLMLFVPSFRGLCRMSRKHRPRKRRPQTANLENADLENAELENTDLGNADLENADLEDVICELIEKLRSFIFTQWKKGKFKRAEN